MTKLLKKSFFVILATGLVSCAFAGDKEVASAHKKMESSNKITMDAPKKKVIVQKEDEITRANKIFDLYDSVESAADSF